VIWRKSKSLKGQGKAEEWNLVVEERVVSQVDEDLRRYGRDICHDICPEKIGKQSKPMIDAP
jgi:hypothetical protein